LIEKEATKAASREEAKKVKKAKEEQEAGEQKSKIRIRIRLIPIWLRVLLVLILMAVSTIVGLMIGYGVIGSGNPFDVLDRSTWQHIIDLVEKE
jgi:DNA-directed RNA polymerase subunit beta